MTPPILCHRCQMLQQIEADLLEIELSHSHDMTDAERFKSAGRRELELDHDRWQKRPCTCRAKEFAS